MRPVGSIWLTAGPDFGSERTIFLIPDGCNTPGRMLPSRFHVHKAYKLSTKDITAIYTIKFFSLQQGNEQWTWRGENV